MSENKKNMLIISTFDRFGKKTFGLIPVEENCPYVEAIYLPMTKSLVVMSKVQHDTFQLFPRLNDNGDIAPAKNRSNGATYREERKALKVFYEYTLTNEEDILMFINFFAVNGKDFQIGKYVEEGEPNVALPKAEKKAKKK